jgi:uncharacterized NAD(P)/FAD-binding protein YdhS
MYARGLRVALVGAGPRGLSVVERICARERRHPSHVMVTVHVVDSERPGPGQVWRTRQSPELLMNTVASQVTVYTDDSVSMSGPVEPGPSLHEWARSVSAGKAGEFPAEVRAEAARLGPDSYPTRAFYGRYLEAAFDRLVADAPGHVRVRVHRERAVALDTVADSQLLTLADGTQLAELDAVVLAQGHLPRRGSATEAELGAAADRHGLVYLPPANPADTDLSGIEAGAPVLLRGLGLNFCDYMALLTVGRGGRFEPRPEREGGGLVYHPSGEEPVLWAGSRRGVPSHARGENQKGPYGRHQPWLLTPEAIERLRARRDSGRPVDFATDLWPLIAKEAEGVYYRTLLISEGRDAADADRFVRRFLDAPEETVGALLDEHGIGAASRWDWQRIEHPCEGHCDCSRAEFERWVIDHLVQDAHEARSGNVDGPLKAALDVLRDLRNEVRLVVDHGGLDGDSHRSDLDHWYTPLNAYLSIGPPVSRTEEMVALLRAGVLRMVGPGMRVHVDEEDGVFVATSDRLDDEPVTARALVEARLPDPDIRDTADPLLRYLADSGQVRTHRVESGGGCYETGGLAVTERPYRVLDRSDRPHPRRFAYGVPTESVHWVTAAGIRPGVDSVTLGDSDAIAQAVLALPPTEHHPAGERHGAEEPGNGARPRRTDLTPPRRHADPNDPDSPIHRPLTVKAATR